MQLRQYIDPLEHLMVLGLLYTRYLQAMIFMKQDSGRKGYFEVVRVDAVIDWEPFHQQYLRSRFECFQICLETTADCRSLNWNEATKHCQLVVYDRHTRPKYKDQVFLKPFNYFLAMALA